MKEEKRQMERTLDLDLDLYDGFLVGNLPWSLLSAERMKIQAVDLFKEGRLGLQQLAMVDAVCDAFYAQTRLVIGHVNLSILDYWAIGHMFPVFPIHKLTEKPTVQAILSDLTCDSKIDTFFGGFGPGGPGGLAVHSWASGEEPYYLEKYFGMLGSGVRANVMGDADKDYNWHVYSAYADDGASKEDCKPVFTLEMCMTQLDRERASLFYKSNCKSAGEMTLNSGIRDILPGSNICDF